jgi:phosphoribosylformylglycinamidine synthase
MSPLQLQAIPEPAKVTPELLRSHSITNEEYERILTALGRIPSLTELGIYSVMWSEHCSYKSSRVHLKRLPTKSERVVQGPGENAGIIDVGDGWACAFKIESHNHPSYIEPREGSKTGVGGILRDIFTMNARPLAVMDSLRFGPVEEGEEETDLLHKNHAIVEGVVDGIASYGNCFGVPNLGGETKFEACYSGNPLVNAFALGMVRLDEIFYAKATGVGNPVIYVGAKTGRDGIHGATMASEEFTEGSEQKRPNVQVGDPFMEKLLLEACIEAMNTGAVVGIQDMGAAGLTCSTCEMGARGGVGLVVELDDVPQRETGMSSYEIMLSESQERMLLVAEKGREDEILRVFDKWGLDGVIVGTVEAEPILRIYHHGKIVACIPNQSLTDDAPLYHRPVGEWAAPVPREPSAEILAAIKAPRDYTADLLNLLKSSNICSKRWVYEQYDSMVQTNTAQGPGGEAGVMRMKQSGKPGHERGLAMSLDGNGRWCYLNPKLGAMLAVAESSRKVACTGATPVAATNCLNFGNPEKPEIMRQLSDAIDGISEACIALGTPITGGNVSLYNETRGEGIYPTPVLGIVGVLDDVTKAVGSDFRAGQKLVVVGGATPGDAAQVERSFGSSEYARIILKKFWGEPPTLDLNGETALQKLLISLADKGLVTAARDISDGGLAVSLAEGCFRHGVGAHFDLAMPTEISATLALFSEGASHVILAVDPAKLSAVCSAVEAAGCFVAVVGEAAGDRLIITNHSKPLIDAPVSTLRANWSAALEAKLGSEA